MLLIGLYSYMSDISPPESRTTRLGIFNAFLVSGFPLGTFVSAYIFKYGGYFAVYGTALAIQVVVLLSIKVFVKDTKGPYSDLNSEPLTDRKSYLRRYVSIIDYNQLLDVLKVTFKKREFNKRRVIITLVSVMLIAVGASSGEFNKIYILNILTEKSLADVLYLFARKKFEWNEQIYTKFQTSTFSKNKSRFRRN